MRLEMASFRVTRATFGETTALRNGVLTLDRAAVAAMALGDSNLTGVAVELAAPGESTRIIHVIDAIEPRFKPAGSTFPWFISPPDMLGPGAPYSPFSDMCNVVLQFSFAPGVHIPDAAASCRKATMRVAKYLAEATRDLQPDGMVEYELGQTDQCPPRV